MDAIFHELSKQKSEITFSKLSIAVFSVILFFVLPCVLIGNNVNVNNSQSKEDQSQTAKVAGISTTSEEKTLNSQSGLFIIFGLILFTVAIILLLYLFTDKTKYKKFKY